MELTKIILILPISPVFRSIRYHQRGREPHVPTSDPSLILHTTPHYGAATLLITPDGDDWTLQSKSCHSKLYPGWNTVGCAIIGLDPLYVGFGLQRPGLRRYRNRHYFNDLVLRGNLFAEAKKCAMATTHSNIAHNDTKEEAVGEQKVEDIQEKKFSSDNDIEASHVGIPEAEAQRILKKVDYRLVPLLALLYLIAFIDRSNSKTKKLSWLP